jgi:endoglucanase
MTLYPRLAMICALLVACAADPPASKYAQPGGKGSMATAGTNGAVGQVELPPVPLDTPVGRHGALQVSGNRIVDAAGAAVQLRGMSLFWSQWSNFYTADSVDQLAGDWSATLVRAALGVESGGYLQNQAANEAKVVAVADRAIERGIYVIIDWHDHHAQDHLAAARDFFTRMARRYGASPAVLFEIYNEPMGADWPTVKAYAEPIIAAIRAENARNLIIVGTPNWSQDVDVAALSPITADAGVAYTLHFYAATHKQWLRDKAEVALEAGLPLFVTEWGSCEANGAGMLDPGETATWLDFMSQHQISWANWALNDKAETSSALVPGTGTKGPWPSQVLTASGKLVKAAIPSSEAE